VQLERAVQGTQLVAGVFQARFEQVSSVLRERQRAVRVTGRALLT